MDKPEQLHEKMLAMNEALLLGSLRQHELTEAAERLNEQLHAEISERKRQEDLIKEHNALLMRQKAELEATLERLRRLEGLLSICMSCKKIRSENNDWHQLEKYISEHSDAVFSHGLCPECLEKEMKKLD